MSCSVGFGVSLWELIAFGGFWGLGLGALGLGRAVGVQAL